MVNLRIALLAMVAMSVACSPDPEITPPAFNLPIVGSELANPLTDTVNTYGAVFDASGKRLVVYDTAEGVTSTVDVDWPDDFTLVDLVAHTRANGVVDAVVLGYGGGALQTLIAWFDPQTANGSTLSAVEVTRIAGWTPLRAVVDDLLIVAGAEFIGTQYGGVSVAEPRWVPLGVYPMGTHVRVYGLMDTASVSYSVDLSSHAIAGPDAVSLPTEIPAWRSRRDALYTDHDLQISADWFVLDATVPAVPTGGSNTPVARPLWRGSDSQLTLRSGHAASTVTSALELGQSVVAVFPVRLASAAQAPVWAALADGALVRLVADTNGYAVAGANRRAAQATVPQLDDQAPFSNPTLSLDILGPGDGRYFLPSQSMVVSYEEPLAAFVRPSGFPAGVSIEGAWAGVLRVGDVLERASGAYTVTAVTETALWLSAPWPGGKPTNIKAPGRFVVYGVLSGLFGTLLPGESLERGGLRMQVAAGSDAVNQGDRFEFGYETQLRPFRGVGALAVTGWSVASDQVWTLDRVGGSLASWRPSNGDALWRVE